MPSIYYVSDRAYNRIVGIARTQGFIAQNSRINRGIGKFIIELSAYQFEDTRPKHIKERHRQEMQSGRAPTWKGFEPRVTRCLDLSEEVKQRYINIATSVGILRNIPWIIGGPSRIAPTQVIGYVLESYGLGWITPIDVPRTEGPR